MASATARPSASIRGARLEVAGVRQPKVMGWTHHAQRWIWAGLGVFLAVIMVAFVIGIRQHVAATRPPVIDGMTCLPIGTRAVSAQVHLDVFVYGQAQTIPAAIGYADGGACQYPLYTSDTSGVVSVALPSSDQPTLGQFFQVWNKPLSLTSLEGLQSGATVGGNTESIHAYVNGKAFTGNPAAIPLTAGSEIALEYGPPWPSSTPATYAFPASAAASSAGSASAGSASTSGASSVAGK